MKICHVNLARTFRGGERQTLLLVAECVREYGPDNTSLVCRKGGALRDKAREVQGLTIFEVDSQITGHFKVARWSPQIVHAHEGRAVYWAFIQHMLFRVPYMLTRRIQQQHKPRLLNSIALNKAERIIAISSAIESEMRERFTSITVIPSTVMSVSVDSELLAQKRSRSVLMAGALDLAKGHGVMLQAFELLPKEWSLYIIGDGPELESINNLIELSDARSRIHLFPWDPHNAHKLMGACEYFAMPSLHEGLGSVILDAMQFECIVIGSDVGGIPDLVIDQVTGLLFPPNNPASIQRTLIDVDSNSRLKQSLIEAAKKHASQHVPSVMMSKYAEVYEEVLSE